MTTMTMTRNDQRTSQQHVTERVRTMVMSAGLAAIVAVTMAMTAGAMYDCRTGDTGGPATNARPVPERAPGPSAAPRIVSERYYGV